MLAGFVFLYNSVFTASHGSHKYTNIFDSFISNNSTKIVLKVYIDCTRSYALHVVKFYNLYLQLAKIGEIGTKNFQKLDSRTYYSMH